MRNSLLVVGAFVAGCLFGWLVGGLEQVHNWTLYLLYALMFQIGVSVGCSDNLGEIIRTFRPKMLISPLPTVSATLIFSALAGLHVQEVDAEIQFAVHADAGAFLDVL